MHLWIFYQSSDFYESFLQFNSKIKRKQSVQKAEQLIVVKRSSLLRLCWGTLDNYDRLYDINICTVIVYQSSEFCD